MLETDQIRKRISDTDFGIYLSRICGQIRSANCISHFLYFPYPPRVLADIRRRGKNLWNVSVKIMLGCANYARMWSNFERYPLADADICGVRQICHGHLPCGYIRRYPTKRIIRQTDADQGQICIRFKRVSSYKVTKLAEH